MEQLLETILETIRISGHYQALEDLYYTSLEAMKRDVKLGVRYLKILSELIEKRMPTLRDESEIRRLFALHKKVLLAAAPHDFDLGLV